MDGEDAGREAVRRLFVDRLAHSGLTLPKAMKPAAHEAVMKRLVDHLAYLSPQSLAVLADQVLSAAGGKDRNLWPSELMIRQMAEALERRPFEMALIVTSWLASIEGPQAEAGGYLVQMYRHLRSHPRPLLPYDRTTIRQQAVDDAQKIARIREKERDGVVPEIDRAWMAEMVEDQRRARAIVEAGAQARRRKAEQGTGEAA
ncbi:hypothetical protein [Pseudogemmobacter humi]|uniref:Uncharacterized protein n=1 Tax=Pseudogemmobacter humi TaxID=2483812 RepID=A0A3P5XIJ6_9RHOB|nr:hypothetical protein [Pseudogemmobacter humi]VDC31400.1 hypothetical protein XINFAN_02873 [Pseudogemmobacter humi]